LCRFDECRGVFWLWDKGVVRFWVPNGFTTTTTAVGTTFCDTVDTTTAHATATARFLEWHNDDCILGTTLDRLATNKSTTLQQFKFGVVLLTTTTRGVMFPWLAIKIFHTNVIHFTFSAHAYAANILIRW
jgi:hypothetical protein